MQTYTLSDELMDECCTLVHRRWSEAFDILKAVKVEKPDYKFEPDWDQLHEVRLKNAQKDFTKWDRLKQEITPHSPMVKAYRSVVLP